MAKKSITETTTTETTTTTSATRLEKSKSGIVTIPGVETNQLSTLIIGDAPLVCHHFAQKYRDAILAKHMGEASGGRQRKDPEANFEAARYRLSDGTDGVPAGGLKACLARGFVKGSGVPMTNAKRYLRVVADDPATNLCRILVEDGQPTMREDIVRNESGVVDIRHRPQYWPWAMLLQIEFTPAMMSERQVLQAIAMAGFGEGLCEWRPGSKESLSGALGTFRLATSAEVQAFEDNRLFKTTTYAQAAE